MNVFVIYKLLLFYREKELLADFNTLKSKYDTLQAAIKE